MCRSGCSLTLSRAWTGRIAGVAEAPVAAQGKYRVIQTDRWSVAVRSALSTPRTLQVEEFAAEYARQGWKTEALSIGDNEAIEGRAYGP